MWVIRSCFHFCHSHFNFWFLWRGAYLFCHSGSHLFAWTKSFAFSSPINDSDIGIPSISFMCTSFFKSWWEFYLKNKIDRTDYRVPRKFSTIKMNALTHSLYKAAAESSKRFIFLLRENLLEQFPSISFRPYWTDRLKRIGR